MEDTSQPALVGGRSPHADTVETCTQTLLFLREAPGRLAFGLWEKCPTAGHAAGGGGQCADIVGPY